MIRKLIKRKVSDNVMQIIQQAREAADKITDDYEKAKVLAAIARVNHEAKDLEQAREAADKITDDYGKAAALAVIAGISREAKDLEQGREADKIADNAWKAVALATITKALAKVRKY